MSRSDSWSVNYAQNRNAEEARRRREEEERRRQEARRRAIQKELATIRRFEQQREDLKAKLAEKAGRLAEEQRAERAAMSALMEQERQEREEQLQEQLANIERTIVEQRTQLEKDQELFDEMQARIESIEVMEPETYLLYEAIEEAFGDWGQMQVLELAEDEECGWYVRFGHQEREDRVVEMGMTSDGQAAELTLDVHEGFKGDECETFIDDVQFGLKRRGLDVESKKVDAKVVDESLRQSRERAHSKKKAALRRMQADRRG